MLKTTLHIVPTPIGNLGDITLRALEVLKTVDIIACEDTRRTRKLLSHFDIHKKLLPYHEHNEEKQAEVILKILESGKSVALVSNAGMPVISDPGFRLIRRAAESGIRIEALPGPCALTVALQVSAIAPTPFTFVGFLPAKKQKRLSALSALRDRRETLVFFEAPHRILQSLADMEEVLGDRRASLAREMTKIHEEVIRGSFSEIRQALSSGTPLGEMTLVVEGAKGVSSESQYASPAEHLIALIKDGTPKKEAIKIVARKWGVAKSEIYKLAIDL